MSHCWLKNATQQESDLNAPAAQPCVCLTEHPRGCYYRVTSTDRRRRQRCIGILTLNSVVRSLEITYPNSYTFGSGVVLAMCLLVLKSDLAANSPGPHVKTRERTEANVGKEDCSSIDSVLSGRHLVTRQPNSGRPLCRDKALVRLSERSPRRGTV